MLGNGLAYLGEDSQMQDFLRKFCSIVRIAVGKRKTEKLRGCVFLCVKQNASTLDMLVGLIKIMGRSLKVDLNSSRCRVFFEKGYLVME